MPRSEDRVLAIDLARGLAVLFMVWIHVLITFSTPQVMHSPFGTIIEFLGGPPAAPVFMALMGVSFYYSRHTDFRAGVLRGVRIIALGYVLNFLRGVLPIVLVGKLSPAAYAAIPPDVADCVEAFLELDILQFAGLALIVMAVIRQIRVNKYLLLAAAVAIAVVAPLLWGIGTGVPVLDRLLDLLWGDKPSPVPAVGNFVSFPFFPWFAFVLAGMVFGDTLTKSDDIDRTFRRAGAIGLAIIVAGLAITTVHPDRQTTDYYHSGPWAIAQMTGIVFVVLLLCNVAIRHIRPNPAFETLFYWSRNVNTIYLIQWVLIMWVADFALGFAAASYGATVGIMAAMVIASHGINALYLRLRRSGAPLPRNSAVR
jgi:uncharacterized membrane protein